jgi:hypothetical protein
MHGSLVAAALGGLFATAIALPAAQPADPPHVGRCHVKVDKLESHPKHRDGDPAHSRDTKDSNNQSVTTGAFATCK